MQLIKEVSSDKLRGGFYTPKPIASFILKWALAEENCTDILEPSCGDGVFLKAIKESSYKFKSLTAIELDPVEAEKSSRTKLDDLNVINDDFHRFCINTDKRFDIIIGNPPYIRYQYFNKEQQEFASKIFESASLKYSKLTNAWVSFVVGSSLLLKDQGKIGFVLPAEILQVSYAQPLREFLASFYTKINIISFQKLVFPDIQQEVVLLLCEKNSSNKHSIDHIEVKDVKELMELDLSRLKREDKKIDFKTNKWTFYFLDQDEIDFLENVQKNRKLQTLGHYAKVEVGITTGANPFFTVPHSTVKQYNLEEFALPMVGRSVQVPSVIFTKEDWLTNRDSEARTQFLSFPSMQELNSKDGAYKYIKLGEENNIHKGYKCRIRDEWQIVPSQRVSDALFIRRNNKYPKLIVNQLGAFTTDTMHRVTVNDDISLEALTASYYNSLSFAFAEICGRSHGGGVLELMPNEAESITIPYNINNEDLLESIDQMMRQGEEISEILKITNKKILKENFGFSEREITLANNIWQKLSSRRLNRSKK